MSSADESPKPGRRTAVQLSGLALRESPSETDELVQMRSQLSEIARRLARRDAETDAVSIDLQQLRLQLAEITRKLAKREAEIETRAAQVGQVAAATRHLQAALDRAQREGDDARRRISRLESEFRKIQSSVAWKLFDFLGAAPRLAAGLLPDFKIFSARPHVKAARLVAASELFDRTWYESQNPDVAGKGFDAALHYVSHGAAEGRDPGPDFNTRQYLKAHKDVAEAGINPLVHYLLHGRAEGREVAKSAAEPVQPVKPALPSEPAVAAAEAVSFALPQLAEIPWTRQKDITRKDGQLAVELSGLLVGTVSLLDAPKSGVLSVLATYCRLMRLDSRQVLSCSAGNEPRDTPAVQDAPVADDAYRAASFQCSAPGVALVDAWYINDRDLRIRFSAEQPCVARFFQYDPPSGALAVVGESMLTGLGVEFADLSLVNALMPVLTCFATPEGQLLSTSTLPFPSLCRGGVHYGELCAMGRGASYLENLQMASESLLRDLLDAAAPLSIGRIEVDLQDAIGSERIFSTEVREWLLLVMRVVPRSSNAASVLNPKVRSSLEEGLTAVRSANRQEFAAGVAAREREGAAVLTLPADALPTLHALIARGPVIGNVTARLVGSWVLAETATGNPLWNVVLPPMGGEFLALQPVSRRISFPVLTGPSSEEKETTGDSVLGRPLAIRFCEKGDRHPATMITPVASEVPVPLLRAAAHGLGGASAAISVLVASMGGSKNAFSALLESLKLQTAADRIEVIAIGAEAGERDALERLFPGRYLLVDPEREAGWVERINLGAEKAGGEFLLVVGADVVLHDPRTLETLCAMAEQEKTASAGCVLLQASAAKKALTPVFRSGGYFPTRPGGTEELAFSEFDCFDVFPLATYPVAANSSALFLVRVDVWRTLHGFDAGRYSMVGDLEYGLRAAAMGFRHLCTSVVSAEISARELSAGSAAAAEPIRPPEGWPLPPSASLIEALRP